jgi:hypothetical protein
MTMPRQQINLYQFGVPRGLAGLSARALLITLSVIGLALLVVWAYSHWQLAQLHNTVDTINAQHEQQQ